MIQDEIRQELDRVLPLVGGRKPDHLYLGEREHGAMMRAANEFGLATTSPVGNEVLRMTYMGMRVYRVDAASFIGFGPAQPSPCG